VIKNRVAFRDKLFDNGSVDVGFGFGLGALFNNVLIGSWLESDSVSSEDEDDDSDEEDDDDDDI
jgi:hypothetical protein